MIFNGQNFPLYLYDRTLSEDLLSDLQGEGQGKKYAIKKTSLDRFRAYYAQDEITETDIFYYIYGLLHSPSYRERFSNNLLKDLARIPFVRTKLEFEQYRDAGFRLSDLHVDFMDVTPFLVQFKEGDLRLTHIEDPKSFFHVEKMKFAKKGDKSTVVYNKNITIENIPLEAYDYVVNGKPALEWVMERQCVKTDKASGIVNDANDYANETMNNPAYPLELFKRVITVSLETMKIVKSLPKLEID